MAYFNLTERARVWNSLDDNLREQVTSGKLSWEEAAELVVPIGDVELATARAQYPTRPEPVQTGPAPEEYGIGTMRDISIARAGAFVDTVGAKMDADTVDQAIAIKAAQEETFGETLDKRWTAARADNQGPGPNVPWYLGAGAQLAKGANAALDFGTDAVTAFGEAAQTQMQAAVLSDRQIEHQAANALTSLSTNVAQLEATRNALNAMPVNPYSKAFVEKFDEGDYIGAAFSAPLAVATTFGEQAPTLLAQMGITAGTYAVTKSKAATARAAVLAGGVGGLSEYGSDYLSIIETMPEEDRRNLTKIRAALEMAKEAAIARTVIEALVPRGLSKLGATTVARTGLDLAGQMVSGAAGEAAAASLMGQERTAGELALEALADSAGTITESIPSLRKAAQQDQLDSLAETYVERSKQQFAEGIQQLDAEANANRAVFDAEVEAENALQSLRDSEALNRGEQIEMPFGSGEGGNIRPTNADGTPTLDADGNPMTGATGRSIPENDRVPTMVDMFSGESTAAPRIVARQVAAEEAAAEGRLPEETDEAFEIRQQRTTDARNQIDARKQKDFEDQKQRENSRRQLQAEDRTILKNERQLLSTTDITREAKRKLAVEAEGVRRQRAGIIRDPKKLDAVVKAYERKRLPELVDNERNRRLARVNAARDREIAEENRQAALEDIDVDNELAQRQTERDTAAKAATATPANDLFENQPGQQELLLPPTEQPRTQPLTQEQELAAGQLRRQTLTEKMRPAQKAAEQQRLDATTPAAEKAIQQERQKRASLTTRTYNAKERAAIAAIVKAELDVNHPDEDARKVAVAQKIVAWQDANPRPAEAAAPKTEKTLVEKAQTVKSRIEGREKGKKTRAETKELERLIKEGATPEEAAATLSNRALTPEEDAAARAELELPAQVFTGEESTSPLIKKTNELVKTQHGRLYDALKNTLNSDAPNKLEQMLDLIMTDRSVPMFQRGLAARLKPLIKRIGTTAQGLAPDDTRGGVFRPDRNDIGFSALAPKTILHEVLHAVLYNAMSRSDSVFTSPADKANVQKLRTGLEDLRRTIINDFDNTLKRPDGTPYGTHLSRNKGPLSSIDELIAYFMTDPKLQELLKDVPSNNPITKRVAFWARNFYNHVLAFLGYQDTSNEVNAMTDLAQSVGELLSVVESNIGAVASAQIARAESRTPVARQEEAASAAELPAQDVADPAPDFTNPTTRREYFELTINGRQIGPKILKEIVSFGGGAKALLNALTAGAIKHAPTTRAIERAQSSTAALTRRADKLIEGIDGSLARIAADDKKDLTALRAEFTALTEKYEKTPKGLERKKLAKEIRDKFSIAGRNFFVMRRTIDNLSRAILRERLNDPTPLTEAEFKIYKSIKANIGTYYTRVYASTMGDVGVKRAKALLTSYNKVVKGKKVKESDRKSYEIVRNGVQYIRDHLLLIPDAATLEDMSNAKLNKLAAAWGIPLDGVTSLDSAPTSEDRRDYLIARLTEFADKNQAAREQQAYSLIEGMLLGKKGNNSLVDYFRGSKLDNTIVTEREFVPPEIRALLGEFEDKFVRGMTTIARQGEFLSRMKMLNTLRETEAGGRVLSEAEFRDGGFSPQDWTRLSGPSYGALQGTWVRNDLAERIEDTQQVALTFGKAVALMESNPQAWPLYAAGKVLSAWQWTAGNLKALALVYNPMNAAWNFGGGPLIMLSNGNLNPKHVARAFATARDLILSQRQGGRHNDAIEKVIRAGITDSAFMGDIKASELEQLRQVLEESSKTKTGRVTEKVNTSQKTFRRLFRESYAMADVVWKIANFYAQEQFITDLYKAEGIEATARRIEDAAAWRTNLTNFSYKRVPNLFKSTEKLGLTYIAPYMYETLRAPISSFIMGVSDIAAARNAKTPEGRNLLLSHGTKRALGSVLSMGAMQAMLYTAVRMMLGALDKGEDEKDEWVEDLKVLLPEFKAEAEYEYVGRTADGKPVLVELSRVDPFGPSSELYSTILRGDPEEIWNKFSSMWINNPYGTTAVQAALGTGGTTTRMEQYGPEAYNAIVKAGELLASPVGLIEDKRAAGERLAKVVDVAMPSLITRALDVNNTPPVPGVLSEGGVQMLEALTNFGGMSIQHVDADKAVQFRAMDFEDTRDSVRRELYSFLETTTNMTDEELLDRYLNLQERETEAYENLDKLYNGMQKIGYEPGAILSSLKAEGLTEADLAALATGSWTQGDNGVVSLSGIERNYTAAVQRAGYTAEQEERYKQNILRVIRLVEEGQINMRE